MKLLSFTVPCYNSAAYMRRCIDSILIGGEEIEIIIVNDGSKDETARIAEEYAEAYPSIVKVIHQENGGHGSAVNTGIEAATGLYFKVVDSDDRVDAESYRKILEVLRKYQNPGEELDMMISDFEYDKEGESHHKVMQYKHIFPEDRVFTWEDVHHIWKGHYILMHSVIYKTALLKNCGMKLPKHTFYVDNIYVFEPMAQVERMYYLDVNFYRYYIGRADQSVQESVMISRIDQQIKVNKLMYDFYCSHYEELSREKRKCQVLFNYLEIITVISTILLAVSGTEESLKKRKELWDYLKEKDPECFKKLRYGIMCGYTNLPGKIGRKVSIGGYKISQKIFKFN